MTFEQGAILVISTLGTVVTVLFGLVLAGHKKQISFLTRESTECKQDRAILRKANDDLHELVINTPNPKFCVAHNCPMRPIGEGSVQLTLSAARRTPEKPQDNTPSHPVI